MSDVNLFGESVENVDPKEAYMKTKDALKSVRSDLKDIIESLDAQIELTKIMKRVKELREEIKSNETVIELNEKIQTGKERLELLKEMIRIEMLDRSEDQIEVRDRLLKLQSVIRDIKNKKSKYHPDQLGFNSVDNIERRVKKIFDKFDKSVDGIVNDPDSGIDSVSIGLLTPDGEYKETTI